VTETFESLFRIGVETETGISNLQRLDEALLQTQKNYAGILQTIKEFRDQTNSLVGADFTQTGDLIRTNITEPLGLATGNVGILRTSLGALGGSDLASIRTNIEANVAIPLQSAAEAAMQLQEAINLAAERVPGAGVGGGGYFDDFLYDEPPPPPLPIIPQYIKGQQGGYDPSGRGSQWRSESGAFATQAAVFTELAESGKAFEEIEAIASSTFMSIGSSAREAAKLTYNEFEKLSKGLVGGSVIPDMVRDINRWLAQIHASPEVLAELEAMARQIRSTFTVPPDMAQQGVGVAYGTRGGFPDYIQGQQTGWDPSIRQVRSHATGRTVGRQQFIRDTFIEELAEQRAMESIMGWEDYDPELLAGMRGWRPEPPPAPLPQPYATGGLTGATEEYIGGDLAQRVETFREEFDRLGKSGEVVSGVMRDTTRTLDGQGKTISRVTRETETYSNTGRRVVRTFRDVGDAAEKSGRQTQRASLFSNRFFRHLVWIGQGIFIWQGIQAIQDFGREVVTTFSEMEQAASRTAFVMDSTTQQIMLSQREMNVGISQFGVTSPQGAQAQLTMARYGVQDPEFARDAARLAQVGQMEMGQATEYLLSVQRQWNLELGDTGMILDTLATMYATAPRSMEEFLEMMRQGPALAGQMGLSFQEYMTTMARAMSFLPEQAPSAVSGLLGRLFARIYQGDTAKHLASDYGVGVFDPQTLERRPGLDVLDDIAKAYQGISSEAEKAALAELVAGARQGQSWQQAKVLLDNWTVGIREAETALRDFDQLSSNVMDTHKGAVDELTGSFSGLVAEIGAASGVVEYLDESLRGLATGARFITDISIALGGITQTDLMVFLGLRGMGLSSADAINTILSTGAPRGINKALNLPGAGAAGITGTAAAAASGAATVGTGVGGDFGATVNIAGQEFYNSVTDAADDFEKTLLETMLATGWTPSPSVVDVSEYSTSEINQALAESSVDTERMISAYRSFLERSTDLDATGIQKAMDNFTQKLLLQLQFFRLPGGEIRLMEGRDLLFYLSQIEENTRPLEGIWNVPEGMRVWVPIESTFYGDWRDKQEEAGAGDEVTLDSSAFDAATRGFANSVSELGMTSAVWREAAMELRQAIVERAVAMQQDVRVPEYGYPYSPMFDEQVMTPDPYRPQWLVDMEHGFRELGNTVAQFTGATDRLTGWIDVVTTYREQVGGVGDPGDPEYPGTSSALNNLTTMLGTYLPLILKLDENQVPVWADPDAPGRKLDVQVPQPLDVNVSQTVLAAGTQIGMTATGMPTTTNSMAGSMRSVSMAAWRQLSYLMTIAQNTGNPPTVNVNVTGGTEVASATTEVNDVLTREWALSNGVYEVPT
jgi:TP901 family phage tail tape measure protein